VEIRESDKRPQVREIVAVLLLSVTAILTAWTGFQASKWAGAMSIAFSQASTARIEATRLDAVVNRKQTIQVALFVQWVQAHQVRDERLADFLAERFPEPLATAFPVWLDSRPFAGSGGAGSPFELPEYSIPEQEQATEADGRADAKFQEALRNNQRSDDYTVLTVGFAAVLFFAALSGRMRSPRTQWAMLGLGLCGFVVLSYLLLTFPKLV
jgi:hypothetical protein